MSVEKPYKVYRVRLLPDFLYIIKDNEAIYKKIRTEHWHRITYYIDITPDVKDNVLVFVRDMSEEELFLELL